MMMNIIIGWETERCTANAPILDTARNSDYAPMDGHIGKIAGLA